MPPTKKMEKEIKEIQEKKALPAFDTICPRCGNLVKLDQSSCAKCGQLITDY